MTHYPGDSTLPGILLRELSLLQRAGIFPSTRIHASQPEKRREDNNIFFTGLIVLGLENLRPMLGGADTSLCDSIVARAKRAYPLYRNAHGRLTYNFWQTKPPVIFPGDPWLRLGNRSHALPDDLDDTSILLAGLDPPDSSARRVKALMEACAGGTLHNGYRRYKRRGAYSTWFGKNMPLDMDASVLCNVLYWVCRSGQPWTHADSASISVLRDLVVRGRLLNDAAYASPHYARPPVVIYHYARLMSLCPALDSVKPLLVGQAREALKTAVGLDRVLLSTALLRLGVPVSQVAPGTVDLGGEDARFVFFIASFSDYFRNPFRRIFLHTALLRYEFRCDAYNRFLLLEYLLVREAAEMPVHSQF